MEPLYPKPGKGRPPVQPVGPGGGRDAVRLGGDTAKPRNPSGMSSTPLGELRQDPAFPDRRNLLDQKTYLFRESLGDILGPSGAAGEPWPQWCCGQRFPAMGLRGEFPRGAFRVFFED